MNFYKHFISDYDGDTSHLSWDEDMAYTRLLRAYYRREGPFPLDMVLIHRIVRASTRPEKRAVERVLAEFFTRSEVGIHNKRADEEIYAYKKLCEVNRAVGKLGGRPKGTARVITDNREETETVSGNNPHQNQIPEPEETTTTPEAFVLPEWLPKEQWKAWLEVRKKSRVPNTPRALKLAICELERLKSLGHDPATVLDQSTLKGWRSVYPLKPELSVVTTEPKSQFCDYCAKASTGTVNGRRHCSAHMENAMDGIKPMKVA